MKRKRFIHAEQIEPGGGGIRSRYWHRHMVVPLATIRPGGLKKPVHESFEALVPKDPFNLGAWELTARISELDVDDDLYPNFADADATATGATAWGAGINWHLNRNVKLQFNYEQTDFEGGTADFLKDGEKVIFARAQIAF